MKKVTTITLRMLPDGSVVRGKVPEHAYVIEKLTGDVVAYAGASVYRVGDRIPEDEAQALQRETQNQIVTLKCELS